MKKDLTKEISETKTATQEELKAVLEAKSRVEAILGIVGEEALVGTYSRNADKDRHEANRWRWIALAAVAATAAIGIWIVVSAIGPATDWDLLAAKLALALPVAGAAAYAARPIWDERQPMLGDSGSCQGLGTSSAPGMSSAMPSEQTPELVDRKLRIRTDRAC